MTERCEFQQTSSLRYPALLTIIMCLILASCSMPGTSQKQARESYLLEGTGTADLRVSGQAESCLTLRVATPVSAPGYSTNRMAYTTQASRLDYFAYHQWADTPARMIASLIETRLDSSKIFEAVVSGSADIRTDLRLDSELLQLRQDFNSKNSTLKLTIKVKLIDVATRSLLRSTTFKYTEPVNEKNPESGVEAANHAADKFMSELEDFLAQSTVSVECN